MEVWENDAVGARAARGSKLQPLDAGIIAHWKVLYRKRMLQYVCSQVDGEVRTELLYDDLDVQLLSDISIDDDYDKKLEESSIKSLAEALCITDQLRHFAQFNGYQDLSLSVGMAIKRGDLIITTPRPRTANSIDGLFKINRP